MRRIATLVVGASLLAGVIGQAQEFYRLPEAGSFATQEKGDQPLPKKQVIPEKKAPTTQPEVIAAAPAAPSSQADLADRRIARVPEMLGDVAPASQFVFVPAAATVAPVRGQPVVPAGAPVGLGVIPGIRWLKVADNGSPRPQDRIYMGFNFYENLYDDVNRALGADVREIRLYRSHFGFEKTFFDRRFSFGMRLPFNTLSVQSAAPSVGGSHTAVGDLALITQAGIWRDEEFGDYLSIGLGMTLPTGPNTLGNIGVIPGSHTWTWQPFLGGLVNAGNLYLQGFTAVDFPSGNDVTLWYSDLGLGIFVLRAEERQLITAIAPALEMHSAVSLNGGNTPGPTATFGYANVINAGLVLNMEFLGRSRFALGGMFPLTSPQPFDAEVIAQMRFVF